MGVLELDGRQAESGLVKTMSAQIRHRGPDDAGFYIDGGTGLGISRLSIIDLTTGDQPIWNEDRSKIIVFNGEIYNYLSLRNYLGAKGHTFRSSSDTEVIVHAFEEWGAECCEHLEGMFAFAIWDTLARTLFIARDRLGQKPLYYHFEAGSQFLFASEIKAILQVSSVERRASTVSLDLYLSLGYVPSPHTLFRDIYKLPAGHSLTIKDGELSLRQYWNIPSDATGSPQAEDASTILFDQFEIAVKDRLVADVPVGSFLSGGVDSSFVSATMSSQKKQRIKTFSVGFRSAEIDESESAYEISRLLDSEHHHVVADQCSPELFRRLVWHMDEPIADPAIVPTYLVSKLAREDVKVALTGEGSDELFAGYYYYPSFAERDRYQRLPRRLRSSMLVPLAEASNHLLGRERFHPRTIWGWQLSRGQRLLPWVALFTDKEKSRLYSARGAEVINQQLAANIMSDHVRGWRNGNSKDAGPLKTAMYLDTKMGLADDLLMKVDKMSMAASLEARSPFLDHRLVELAFSMPDNLKLSESVNKSVLREAAAKVLPNNVAHRAKHGFEVPANKWLSQDLKELFWSLAASQEFGFQHDYMRDLWNEMCRGVPGRGKQIWSLLTLFAWADIYNVKV